ncbi:unnamed protein product [Tilletia controversa]|uniref:HIG1 domain-containing protein n=3 Tax=Tilletia TaxID=13289 RepID=A0A8X7MZW8_9BASI|nr:hypothetical protein CF336_g1050 [Tilletia laevis]KAE8204628.1 hypothetical protein CF328_g979 [Tilletia controversa]KAE8262616.1 hypothetical protein A4X03_0g2324 [Tilletia caries]KAE8205934.1 hypothetical protein CF335_g2143 [Tilletia laevis]KAE8253530.1 hypothetical protein A4X06_0g1383 [Tilletia controversa]
MPREGYPPGTDPNAPPPLLYTSQIGTAVAPRRRRHREAEVEHAYEIQKDAAIRGAAIWTFLGGTTTVMAHYLFPGFRKQTLAFKAFLVSGATIFGLVVGADTVLLNHESQERSEEHAIRNRARLELGRRGIVASESEIEKWKEQVRREYWEKQDAAAAAGAGAGAAGSKSTTTPSMEEQSNPNR